MPRIAKPRYSSQVRRWFANIGEKDKTGRAKEVFAPVTVDSEAKAWAWFDERLKVQAGQVRAVDRCTVRYLCESHLGWSEKRRDDGRISAGRYECKAYHLTLFEDRFGNRVAASISAKELTEYLEGLTVRYSPNYVSSIASSVAAAFNWAVREKLLASSPVAGFECPVVPASPERFAEVREAAAFLGCLRRLALKSGPVDRRYERLNALMQRLMLRTGARPGELCSMRWSDVRWEAGKTSSGHTFAKAVLPPERWKSGKKTGRARTIYLSPALTRSLRREFGRPDRHPTHCFQHGAGYGGVGKGEPWPSGSALAQKVRKIRRRLMAEQTEARSKVADGKPVSAAELRLLGLEIHDSGPQRITNYRWRHTAISTLLMMRVDVPTIAELCGTSEQMIRRTYGHLLDSHLAAAAEKLVAKARMIA